MDEQRHRAAESAYWATVDRRPAEQHVELPRLGGSIRVQEVGEGPPTLFIHGSGSSGTSWAPLAARMTGFRCLLVDRPGCGLSPPREAPYADIDEMRDAADAFVADVLDGLGIDRADVLATSFGGYLAFRSAAATPERVARLVQIGWSVGAPVRRLPLVMRIGAIPGLGRLLTSVPPTRRAVVAMLRQIGLRDALAAGRVSEPAVAWFHSLLRDTDTLRNEYATNAALAGPIRGLDDRWLLTADTRAAIAAPVRILWGDRDLFGDAGTARTFAAPFPDVSVEILEGAGHAPWMDDPDGVARLVVGALSG